MLEAEVIKYFGGAGVVIVSLLLYIWRNHSDRLTKVEESKASASALTALQSRIDELAEKEAVHDQVTQLRTEVTRIESRADRVASELRHEMNGMGNRLAQEVTSLRAAIDGRFDTLIALIKQQKG